MFHIYILLIMYHTMFEAFINSQQSYEADIISFPILRSR